MQPVVFIMFKTAWYWTFWNTAALNLMITLRKQNFLSICIQEKACDGDRRARKSEYSAETCKRQSKCLSHRWDRVLCPLTRAPWTSALPTARQRHPLKIWTWPHNIPFLLPKFLFLLLFSVSKTLSLRYKVSHWYPKVSSCPWQRLEERRNCHDPFAAHYLYLANDGLWKNSSKLKLYLGFDLSFTSAISDVRLAILPTSMPISSSPAWKRN